VASVEMPECQVHTVEPEGSAALARSLQADQHLHLEATTSEADGLLPLTVGELNWELLSTAGVMAEVISEGQLMASLSILHRRLEIQAEPSGSCSAAPLLAARSGASLPGGTHVAVVSGGNVSSERLARLLSP
jgi:threonine dehydratase